MLSIKFRCADQIRRISVQPSITYTELTATVASLFDLEHSHIRYQDEDGDMISIKSQMDLAEAVSQLSSRCLVLHIAPASPSTPAKPAPAASPARPSPSPAPAPAPAPTAADDSMPDFEQIATEVKARITEALAGLQAGSTSAQKAPSSQTFTPAAAAAQSNFDLSSLLQQALAFFAQAKTAPQDGLEAITRQIESAVLIARVVSLLNAARDKCAGADLRGLVQSLEEYVDVDAIVERVEAEAEKNPKVEKVLDAFREAFSEEDTTPHNAMCDHCDEQIVGVRYKCSVCVDFDLCQGCEKREVHTHHAFIKIEHPAVAWKVALVEHECTFVRDGTIEDGTEFAHDHTEALQKEWVVRNSGEHRWQEGCALTLADHSVPDTCAYTFPSRVNVDAIPAGFDGVVMLPLPAPSTGASGRYSAYYRLVRSDGVVFGPRLSVHFTVKAPFAEQVATLAEFGFTDEGACVAALQVARGDVQRAVALLLGERE